MEWASLLFVPIDMAVAFIQDLFGLGDDDNKEPFRFKDFLFGKDGIIAKAIDFIQDIFKIDFAAIGTKFFDMGKMLKAIVLASGSYTATAMNPFTKGDNLEAASKAYEDKYHEVMGGGTTTTIEGDEIKGDTSQTEQNTKILNEGDTNTGGEVTLVTDSSTKDMSTKVTKVENSYPPMDTGIDTYFESNYREAAFG